MSNYKLDKHLYKSRSSYWEYIQEWIKYVLGLAGDKFHQPMFCKIWSFTEYGQVKLISYYWFTAGLSTAYE